MTDRLSKSEVRARLRGLARWTIRRDSFTPVPSLHREFKFLDFVHALRFVERVAKAAERLGHHPDIHIVRYNIVIVSIYTHSVKGLTDRDFELAHLIDRVRIRRR
jgi:4a-hydroxytetrahydrobiopterin dehydratase